MFYSNNYIYMGLSQNMVPLNPLGSHHFPHQRRYTLFLDRPMYMYVYICMYNFLTVY